MRRRPLVEDMERRILYSADGLAALAMPLHAHAADHFMHSGDGVPPPLVVPHPAADAADVVAPAAPAVSAAPVSHDTAPHELVVIDPRVANYQELVDDIRAQNTNAHLEVVVLNPTEDGLAQIAALLAGQHDVDAVHIISHGEEGGVTLGAGLIDAAALQNDAAVLAQWRAALTPGADILLYGCDVALGSDGNAFITTLAHLTGADVAASTNLTGSAVLGGDWILEDSVGHIEAPVLLSGVATSEWTGTLAAVTVTNTSDAVDGNTTSIANLIASPGADGISLREAILAANNSAGTDTIDFSIPGAGLHVINVGSALTVSGNVTLDGTSQPGYAGVPLVQLDGGHGGYNGLVLTAAAAGSTVSGLMITDFGGDGIQVQGSNITVAANYIGTDGSANLGNGGAGVNLTGAAANDTIGGTVAGAGNIIAFNGAAGIALQASVGTGNLFSSNSIHDNGGLGIDLGNDGVTPNDAGDGDGGPNDLKNFADLASATVDTPTQVTIQGSYSGLAAARTYRIEFFASSTADPSGYGEGEHYLGFTTFNTTAGGTASFTATLSAAVSTEQVISSVVIDTSSNATSEFSHDISTVNHAPVMDLDSGAAGTGVALAYVENGAAAPIAPAATISDLGSADFNGGTLTVSYTANGTAADQLTLLNQGSGAGQIGVSGSTISYGGIVIGSFSGGVNGASLVVSFNGTAATPTAAQALLRDILYSNTSDAPSVLTRGLNFTLVDGDGTAGGGADTAVAAATIAVTATNDAPVIDLNGAAPGTGATLAYTENDAATVVAPAATVSDVDSADFGGGSLTVGFTANGAAEDQLAIRNDGVGTGQIGVSGGTVTYEGTVIGSVSGGGSGSNLVVSFNTAATPTAVQALVHNILYLDTSDNPSTAARSLTYTLVDGDGTANGGTDTGVATATINVAAVNDPAVIAGTTTGAVVEAGGVANGTLNTPTATGTLTDTDVDNPANTFTPIGTAAASTGGFGSYTMTAGGVWSYTLDNTNATVQALNVGSTLTDTFSVQTVDGTAQTITVTINGRNDAAVITGTSTGAVVEAGGVANGTPNTPTATGALTATDVDSANSFVAVTTATAGSNGFGSYTMSAGGSWTYTLDNTNTAVQALNVGNTLTDTFTVQTADGTAQTVTVTINGSNDAAVITGTTTGAVVEAGGVANGTPNTPTATGTLTDTDVDNPANTFTPVGVAATSTGGFGSYTMSAGGVWSYTLDNSNATVQALNVGSTLTDTFSVQTVDGTAQTVTVTINGRNDNAVVGGVTTGAVVEAGGVANGTPNTPTATGTLTDTDVDNLANTFTPVGTATASGGGFGSYTMTAGGVWSYTLDNSNAAVQALNVGNTLTDTFSVQTVDGTAQTVTVTINGSNDAAVIAGTTTGAVVEAGGVANGTANTPTATGTLTDSDVDNPANTFTPVGVAATSTGGFGSYTMTAGGVWSYTLDNSNATVQALNVGNTLTDTFTVQSVDGTAQIVTITIAGRNDNAVVSGTTTGAVVEAGGIANGTPNTPTATGTLTDSDVDNPANTFTPVGTATASTGGFGSYTMTTGGVWSYTLDNSNAAVQALNVGNTLTDTFSVQTADGTAQTITVTINGANDAAVITGTTTGAVVEAGGVANGTPNTPTATGTLTDTDVDNPANTFTPVGVAATSTGGFGSYTMTAGGVWSYTLDNTNATVQALNTGNTLTDTFSVQTVDGTAQTVTVTINGSNDAAVITGTSTGAVVEAGGVANGTANTPTATGALAATDVDSANSFVAVTTATASNNGFGSYTMTTGGVWGYTLDNSNAAVQALNTGNTLTDTFSVQTADGTAQTVTVTINGANDAAVITGTTTGAVVEAGGVNNGTANTPTATGTLTDTDLDNPANTFTPVSTAAASTGGFGSYTMSAGGVWSYTLDNTNATVQALNVGNTLTDTFIVQTIDGTAQTVTVTINGANDAAVITGTTTGAVVEAGGVANGTPNTPAATGALTATDVDSANSFVAVTTATAGSNGFGSYTMTAGGVWAYTLDNTNATVQALNAGNTLTDTFAVQTADGTAQTITVTINGANDAAVITGTTTGAVVEAGGVANGTLNTPTATGTLTDTDVDNPANTFTPVGTAAASTGGFGSYTMSAGGVWSYTLDNSNAAVQALNTGNTLTDTFTVQSVDGTAQTVTVTINGSNDAAVITGTAAGAVVEAGGVANGTPNIPTATGALTAADVDSANSFVAVTTATAGSNGFGSYTMSAGGVWTYTLDNSNAVVQALNVGNTLTDTFAVHTADGTAQTVTVTINGSNDAAVITGTTTGAVVEAGGVANGTANTPTATGTLTDTDLDNPANTFTPVGVAATSTGGFGSYTMTAGGVWSYTLDNSNATVQALNVGNTLTDTFTVQSVDGTAQIVTITIAGRNDNAVVSGTTTGAVVEAGGIANGTPNTPTATGTLIDTDVDNPANTFTPVGTATASSGGFGSYTMTTGGVWSYTLDNSNAAVQALNVGNTLTDTFSVQTADGTAQTITVTINGANDAAVITGTTTGAVVEAGGVANGTPNTPTATGTLTDTDVDNPANIFTPVGVAATSTGGFGSYTMTAGGVWSYTLDNTNATVQALNTGNTLTDTFSVQTVDGTAQTVTVTINGSNDAAVITGTSTGAVVEAGGVNNGTPNTPTATGALTATDVDSTNSFVAVTTATAGSNGFGSYTMSAGGVWTYTLDNSNATVQALNTGHTLTDTFSVQTVDGTAQTVTVTINGSNDAAVITGTTTGAVVEAGGVNNGTLNTPTATGTLTDIDVDNPANTYTPVGTAVASTGGFGSYTMSSGGVWTYTLDNTNATVQALNTGSTLTDTFSVQTVDGTAQTITVTINGSNDAAVITGATTGAVVEAGGVANGTPNTPAATGALTATDVDSTNSFVAVTTATAGSNGFGSYTMTAGGVWAYTLDNTNATVQALNAGNTLTDTFAVQTADGTAQTITVTINGANDAAVITGTTTGAVVEAGGIANGTPNTPTATGTLSDTDVDNLANTFTPVGTAAASSGGFGSYTMAAGGVWNYTLDNTNATVQALNAGNTLTDTFTIQTVDGTAQIVTITINGSNDAAVITGTSTGAVVEAGGVANGTANTPTATGTLTDSDVDNPANTFTPVGTAAASGGGFGSYTMSAGGVWTYTLDNTNATVQALNVGHTLTDTFSVQTVDGTAQTVTVTINGSNDTAVIAGTATGAVVEAGGVANGTPNTPTATGTLTDTDLDNPANTFTPVGTAAASTGGFGSYTMTAGGVWTYTLDNANAAVQALNTGNTLTDTFTVQTADGTAQIVTVTIDGRNDNAVVSGAATGAVTEAGGVANGTPNTPTATGTLTDSDVDNPANTFTPVSTSAISGGGFGSYTMTAGGVWTYTLDNNNAAVQALNVGDSLTDTFSVQTVDGTAQTVTVTINGSNDAAVITGTTTGAVVEAGGVNNGTPNTPTVTGTLTDTDLDNPANTFTAINTAAASTGGFGSYTMTAGGTWAYTLDNTNATVQALNVGDSLTDTFSVQTVDGTAQTVTVTINGSNDAAVITGTTTGAVVEAGGVANGIPNTPAATGALTATDVDSANSFVAVTTATAGSNGFGSYTMSAGGVWTYTVDNSNAAVQALNTGHTLTDTFAVQTADGTAQTVTVTINGSNDAAVITGTTTGAVVEAGGIANGTPNTPAATGTLTDTDVDNAANTFAPVGTAAASGGGFGSYTMTAGGTWAYTLDNTNAAVQALNTGDSLTDTFNVRTVDGTAQTVTVTINGSNDAAVITGTSTGAVVEAGGVANGTSNTPAATGTLTDTDVDNAANTFTPVGTAAASSGGLGSYTMTASGAWTYTLDNTNATVQALNVGHSLTDTFIVQTVDGTAQTITVTINGSNDAAVITGTSTDAVVEAGGVNNGTPNTPTATGALTDTDVDNPANTYTPVGTATASSGGFGSFTMTAAGTWAYTLDNTNASVQALNAGDTLSDTFIVQTVDGTAQTVTIAIAGSNDNAVIAGTTAGTVVEAGGAANAATHTPTAAGVLTDSDVDNSANSFAAVSTATASAGGYGSYTMTAGGGWAYTLDNTNAAVQALNAGDTLTDTFVVHTVDGTAQVITLTLRGSNDDAVIGGVSSGAVVEAGGVANTVINTPAASGTLTDTDVDNPANTFTAVASAAASANGYGSYTVTPGGVWTYTLNNTQAAVEALNVGDTLGDSFVVHSADGTAQTVIVTIAGRNDNAVISGATLGGVTVAGGANNPSPGSPLATGDLLAADKDNPSNLFQPIAFTAGHYGSYALTAAGDWTYLLNNQNPAVQALSSGNSLSEAFTVHSIDGTSQDVTIIISNPLTLRVGDAGPQNQHPPNLGDGDGQGVHSFNSGTGEAAADRPAPRSRIPFGASSSWADAFGTVDNDMSEAPRGAPVPVLTSGGSSVTLRLAIANAQNYIGLGTIDFNSYQFQLGRFNLAQLFAGRGGNLSTLDAGDSGKGGLPGGDQDFTTSTVGTAAGLSVALGVAAWALRSGGLVAAMLSSLPAWRQLDLLPILGDDRGGKLEVDDAADSEAEREERAIDRLLGGPGGDSRADAGDRRDD